MIVHVKVFPLSHLVSLIPPQVTLQATCLTLTAMTIDRYYAIVHPIRSMEGRTPRRAVMVSVGIWLGEAKNYIPQFYSSIFRRKKSIRSVEKARMKRPGCVGQVYLHLFCKIYL